MANTDYIRERLLAYIYPRKPDTEDQAEALDRAVAAQAAFEDSVGLDAVPGNVTSVSNDGVSMHFAYGKSAPSYTSDTISPVAWSIMRNAGLITYALPTARKL